MLKLSRANLLGIYLKLLNNVYTVQKSLASYMHIHITLYCDCQQEYRINEALNTSYHSNLLTLAALLPHFLLNRVH